MKSFLNSLLNFCTVLFRKETNKGKEMKKFIMLLTILLCTRMQTFAMEALELEEDPIVLNALESTLCTNMCAILRTSALEKAPSVKDVSEDRKEEIAKEIMQTFTKHIPTLLEKVPFTRQDNFIDQVTALMQEAANAYPAQMTVKFIMDGLKELSALDQPYFQQRIVDTKRSIEEALNTIQPPRDLRYVTHTLCARRGFVGMSF